MRESILCIFIKIWSLYPKVRNFSCSVLLEMISQSHKQIFSKILLKCELQKYHKQLNKHLLKNECKSDSKIIKDYL